MSSSDEFTPIGIKRRQFLQNWGSFTALSLGSVALNANAASAKLPSSKSLNEELENALKTKEPLIVMVSLEGCPFCRVARDSYLGPMQKQGMPIVQVDMRSESLLKNFAGQSQTHDQMVKAWRVSIAPTLLFFGPKGKEVAERMEGGYLPDFYGAYLDERISAARKILRA